MERNATYSPAFKEQALVKVLSRGSRTIQSVADELNINVYTVKNWMKGKVRKDLKAEPVKACGSAGFFWPHCRHSRVSRQLARTLIAVSDGSPSANRYGVPWNVKAGMARGIGADSLMMDRHWGPASMTKVESIRSARAGAQSQARATRCDQNWRWPPSKLT